MIGRWERKAIQWLRQDAEGASSLLWLRREEKVWSNQPTHSDWSKLTAHRNERVMDMRAETLKDGDSMLIMLVEKQPTLYILHCITSIFKSVTFENRSQPVTDWIRGTRCRIPNCSFQERTPTDMLQTPQTKDISQSTEGGAGTDPHGRITRDLLWIQHQELVDDRNPARMSEVLITTGLVWLQSVRSRGERIVSLACELTSTTDWIQPWVLRNFPCRKLQRMPVKIIRWMTRPS